MIPPVFAATKERTRTPNRSSFRFTPAMAPLSPNTNVPAKSSRYGSDSMKLFPSPLLANGQHHDSPHTRVYVRLTRPRRAAFLHIAAKHPAKLHQNLTAFGHD